MLYLCFCVWLSSVNTIASSSIHGVVLDMTLPFLWLNDTPLCVCATISFLLHKLIDTLMVPIFVAVVGSATINVGLQMSLGHIDIISLEYIKIWNAS